MPSLHFSTDHYRPCERVEALRDTYAAIANVDISPLGDMPIDVSASIQLLPGVSIGHINCSPIRAERGRRQVADGNDDMVFLINASKATSWVSSLHGHDELCCRPGESYLSLRDKPGYIGSTEITRDLITIAFPRATLAPLLRDADQMAGQKILPSEHFRYLVNCARDFIHAGDTLTAEQQLAATEQLYDLALLSLGGKRDAAVVARGRGLRLARLRAIKADINAQAVHGDLSLDQIAGRHAISPSYVRALFDLEGTTFTDYLLEQRLARTYRILSDQRYQSQAISAIAFACGFNNLSWFYRAFRRRYAMTPSELREQSCIGSA